MEIIPVESIPETTRNTGQYLEFRDFIVGCIEEGKKEINLKVGGVHYTTVKAWIRKLAKENKNLVGVVCVRHKEPYVRVRVRG